MRRPRRTIQACLFSPLSGTAGALYLLQPLEVSVGGAAPSPHHTNLVAFSLDDGTARALYLLGLPCDGTARALYLLFGNEQREVVGGKMLRVSDDIRHVFLEILGIPHQTVEALPLPHTPFHALQFVDKV